MEVGNVDPDAILDKLVLDQKARLVEKEDQAHREKRFLDELEASFMRVRTRDELRFDFGKRLFSKKRKLGPFVVERKERSVTVKTGKRSYVMCRVKLLHGRFHECEVYVSDDANKERNTCVQYSLNSVSEVFEGAMEQILKHVVNPKKT